MPVSVYCFEHSNEYRGSRRLADLLLCIPPTYSALILVTPAPFPRPGLPTAPQSMPLPSGMSHTDKRAHFSWQPLWPGDSGPSGETGPPKRRAAPQTGSQGEPVPRCGQACRPACCRRRAAALQLACAPEVRAAASACTIHASCHCTDNLAFVHQAPLGT